MFFGDSIYEVIRKSIADAFYGMYKTIENVNPVIFEYHYVDGDHIGPDGPVNLKEVVDKDIESDIAKEHFGLNLRRVGDNEYEFSGLLVGSPKDFKFSFVREEGKYVDRTIVLK